MAHHQDCNLVSASCEGRPSSLVRLWMLASTVFTPLGQAYAQSSPSPYTTGYRYDIAGRVTGTIAPDPDDLGPLNFAAVRTTYDAAGRPIKTEVGELASWQSEAVAPAGWAGFTVSWSVETGFDAMGRKTSDITKDATGTIVAAVQFSYDAAGRLECTAQRMNPAIYGSLPANACALGTEGSFGPDRIVKHVYDAGGRRIKEQTAFGTPTQIDHATLTYSSTGKATSLTDARGYKATMSYDGFDRQSKWNFPSTTTPGVESAADYEEYGYDAKGNLTSLRKRDGRIFTYAYDALDRLTVKTVPDSCVSGYACATPPPQTVRDVYYGYDLRGRLLYARFDSHSGSDGVASSFDGFGRMTSSTTSMMGTSRTLSYEYDSHGNRTRITHPDGNYFTYAHDRLDRVTAIFENGSIPRVSLSYDAQGRRVNTTRLAGTAGAAVSTTYGYDGMSRLAAISDDLPGAELDYTAGYTWNPASQLVSRSRSNNAYASTSYVNVNRSYATNGRNQYTSAGPATYNYDSNGNLTSDGSDSFTYDAENRLITRSGGASAMLTYDPLGRLYQISGSETVQLLHDGDKPVLRYLPNSGGSIDTRYLHGPGIDEPLVSYAGAGLGLAHALQSDHQGSIVSMHDGTSGTAYAYDEYGIPSGNPGNGFAYTGQLWLPDLGMYYYRARIYSPTLGRFLQTDPLGYDGGLNLYAYAGSDPLSNRDPSGLSPLLLIPQGLFGAMASLMQSDSFAWFYYDVIVISAWQNRSFGTNLIVYNDPKGIEWIRYGYPDGSTSDAGVTQRDITCGGVEHFEAKPTIPPTGRVAFVMHGHQDQAPRGKAGGNFPGGGDGATPARMQIVNYMFSSTDLWAVRPDPIKGVGRIDHLQGTSPYPSDIQRLLRTSAQRSLNEKKAGKKAGKPC